jgi:hypothetical protein
MTTVTLLCRETFLMPLQRAFDEILPLSEVMDLATWEHRHRASAQSYQRMLYEEARDGRCIAELDADKLLQEREWELVTRPAGPEMLAPTRARLRQRIEERRRALFEMQRQMRLRLDDLMDMEERLVKTEAAEEAAARAERDAALAAAREGGCVDANRAALKRCQRKLGVSWFPPAALACHTPEVVDKTIAGIFAAIKCPRVWRMLRSVCKSLSAIERAAPVTRETCRHCHCGGDHVCCMCGKWGAGAVWGDHRYRPEPGSFSAWAVNLRSEPSGDLRYPDNGTFAGHNCYKRKRQDSLDRCSSD